MLHMIDNRGSASFGFGTLRNPALLFWTNGERALKNSCPPQGSSDMFSVTPEVSSQIPHVPMEDSHWTAPGVPDPIDADDDMSMGMLSSTASLRSSILRALEENGRKYHGYKDGKYVLPIDEQELERQESQYYLCLETFEKKLYFAPAERAHRVLDAGCGIGE
ncbi:hypothetical protein OOU_Y34scaffold00592g19 [Pyricularia oryzae Y34]|nr:hypothetical protein OOU_Y34scaffold00592g19 [Pyricularia oryzae Y34]